MTPFNIKEELEYKLEQINEGEISFSEAGDWLHTFGDDILNELNWLREMLEK